MHISVSVVQTTNFEIYRQDAFRSRYKRDVYKVLYCHRAKQSPDLSITESAWDRMHKDSPNPQMNCGKFSKILGTT